MTRWIDIQAHVSLLTIQVCKALHHRRNYIKEQIFYAAILVFGRDPLTILSLFINHNSTARKVWGFYSVISFYSQIYSTSLYSPVISVLFCYLVQIRPEHINRTSVNRNERKLLKKSWSWPLFNFLLLHPAAIDSCSMSNIWRDIYIMGKTHNNLTYGWRINFTSAVFKNTLSFHPFIFLQK